MRTVRQTYITAVRYGQHSLSSTGHNTASDAGTNFTLVATENRRTFTNTSLSQLCRAQMWTSRLVASASSHTGKQRQTGRGQFSLHNHVCPQTKCIQQPCLPVPVFSDAVLCLYIRIPVSPLLLFYWDQNHKSGAAVPLPPPRSRVC